MSQGNGFRFGADEADGEVSRGAMSESGSLTVQIQFHSDAQQGGPESIELVRDRVLFKAKVAGYDVWALLDNRAKRSLIDSTFASSRGLDIAPANGHINTPVGVVAKRRVSDVPLIIPAQLQMRVPALAAVDLRPLFSIYEREVALVLGEDYFRLLAVLIDVDRKMFRLAPSGSAKVASHCVSIELCDGQPHFVASVAGKPLVLAVDLGFEGAVRLTSKAWSRVQPREEDFDPVSRAFNDNGSMIGMVHVPEFAVGSIRAHNMPVQIAPLAMSSADGLLGMGFLKRSPFILDVGMGRLWIAPPRRGPGPSEIN